MPYRSMVTTFTLVASGLTCCLSAAQVARGRTSAGVVPLRIFRRSTVPPPHVGRAFLPSTPSPPRRSLVPLRSAAVSPEGFFAEEQDDLREGRGLVTMLTGEDFERHVHGDSRVAVVTFGMRSCRACKGFQRKFEKLGAKYDPSGFKFLRLDMDDDIAQQVFERYDVTHTPSFLIFHKGQVLGRYQGISETKLKRAIDAAVADLPAVAPPETAGGFAGIPAAAPRESAPKVVEHTPSANGAPAAGLADSYRRRLVDLEPLGSLATTPAKEVRRESAAPSKVSSVAASHAKQAANNVPAQPTSVAERYREALAKLRSEPIGAVPSATSQREARSEGSTQPSVTERYRQALAKLRSKPIETPTRSSRPLSSQRTLSEPSPHRDATDVKQQLAESSKIMRGEVTGLREELDLMSEAVTQMRMRLVQSNQVKETVVSLRQELRDLKETLKEFRASRMPRLPAEILAPSVPEYLYVPASNRRQARNCLAGLFDSQELCVALAQSNSNGHGSNPNQPAGDFFPSRRSGVAGVVNHHPTQPRIPRYTYSPMRHRSARNGWRSARVSSNEHPSE